MEPREWTAGTAPGLMSIYDVKSDCRHPTHLTDYPAAPFGHGSRHQIGDLALFDSYHCSRYNTNTGVLTPKMFRDVFARVRKDLG